MRSGQHILIGCLVAGIIAYFMDGFSIGGTLPIAIIAGAIGSLAPDIIEPARHYQHRDFFHSIRMFRYLFVLLLVSLPIMIFLPLFQWLFFASVGYIFHLAADSTTPMGLPD